MQFSRKRDVHRILRTSNTYTYTRFFRTLDEIRNVMKTNESVVFVYLTHYYIIKTRYDFPTNRGALKRRFV